jgi:hypothetical protein
MKLIKGGLLLAALSVVALTFSSSAMADPIGGAWRSVGNGNIHLDGGLGGSDCTAFAVAGARNGNQITTATFGGCSGAAGTPTALLPWNVTWNAGNTGGTIAVSALANVFGLASCLYTGSVAFTYDSTTRVLNIGLTNIPRASGSTLVCPTDVDVTGSVTLA